MRIAFVALLLTAAGCYASTEPTSTDPSSGDAGMAMAPRYFMLGDSEVTFEDAWKMCEAAGADIAIFDDPGEATPIEQACNPYPCWTGNVVFGLNGSHTAFVTLGGGEWEQLPTHVGPWSAHVLCERQ